MDELHAISQLLTEHETIDKGQFERLLAGEPKESVFAEPEAPASPEPAKEPVPLAEVGDERHGEDPTEDAAVG